MVFNAQSVLKFKVFKQSATSPRTPVEKREMVGKTVNITHRISSIGAKAEDTPGQRERPFQEKLVNHESIANTKDRKR